MQRVILLGASNVTLGFPWIVEGLRSSLPGPVELFAAHGHGRSYGLQSRMLIRRLPGIRECGIWEAVRERMDSERQPLALITDVGNDLLFGVGPEVLLEWVEDCLTRLRKMNAAVTIATLPLESTHRMSPARYHATRMMFFPGKGPDWTAMRRMSHEVDSGLRELAQRHGCRAISPPGEWYGLDPIHVRRRHRSQAWSEILSLWPGVQPIRVDPVPVLRGLRYWRIPPAQRELWGRMQHTAQPVWRDGAGSTIWLY